jgi:hypothetical protein
MVKRYRVVAEETKVLGHVTGDEFEYDFDDSGFDEAAVLASGALEEVPGDEPEAKAPESTKQELLDRTAELGISSDSTMTKAELKAAIEQHHMQEVK